MSLPRGVYLKHKAYYLVRNNRWIRLTDRLIDVPRELAKYDAGWPTSVEAIAAFARLLLARSRANAKGRRGLAHTLEWPHVETMLQACNWRCSITRVPFSLVTVGPRGQRPYAPSIDRLDNAQGYVPANCRLVCTAANIAMNTWGEAVLHELIRHGAQAAVLDSDRHLRQEAC